MKPCYPFSYEEKARAYGAIAAHFRQALEKCLAVAPALAPAQEAMTWRREGIPIRAVEEIDQLLKAAERLGQIREENATLGRRVYALESRIAFVGSLLAMNGCDCECEHHPEEHDDDCARCLACRIGFAIQGVR